MSNEFEFHPTSLTRRGVPSKNTYISCISGEALLEGRCNLCGSVKDMKTAQAINEWFNGRVYIEDQSQYGVAMTFHCEPEYLPFIESLYERTKKHPISEQMVKEAKKATISSPKKPVYKPNKPQKKELVPA